jgi:hypothetical protein
MTPLHIIYFSYCLCEKSCEKLSCEKSSVKKPNKMQHEMQGDALKNKC